MVPRMPPQEARLGFVYSRPYRIQGVSVAGEQAVVHVPELDLAFDIGLCPRPVLAAQTIALSHTHMDHIAGLPYWFSQRWFQKMSNQGRCLCHPKVADALRRMMASWVDLERQRTPHEIIAVEPDTDFELRPNLVIRAIEVSHTVPALGWVVIERRSKLRAEFIGLPQDKLRSLRAEGVQITSIKEIPLVAYTGDTEPGHFLLRPEFCEAQVVVTECTFFEDEHRDRAKIGKHLHVEDLRPLLEAWKARDVVIVHVSRRTTMPFARERLESVAGEQGMSRLHLLMDHRTNKARHESMVAAEGAAADGDDGADTGEDADAASEPSNTEEVG